VSDAQPVREPSDPLLRAVAEHWDEILAAASQEQRDRLRDLVSGAAEPDPGEARAAIADELLDVLPANHPVIRVLRAGVMYGSSVQAPSAEALADSLWGLSLLVLPADDSGWLPRARSGRAEPADEFDRRVRARLLSLPSLSADAPRGDINSLDGRLIRLPRPDGSWQLPAFQFGEAAIPRPIVEEINELLDVGRDPWGATCWWVAPHERLNAAPADLLGTGQDELLRRAAMAIGEEI
jgi:hypothetical protein